MKKYETVDAYLADAPEKVRPILEKLRQIIKKVVLEAEEKMSYGIVGYYYKGRLIYFGYYKKHIGMYPLVGGEVPELEKYRTSKGTASFKLDEKMPYKLIEKWVLARKKANEHG